MHLRLIPLLLVSSLCAACGAPTYVFRPDPPLHARAERTSAELAYAAVTPQKDAGLTRASVYVRLEAAGGGALTAAWLADVQAPPCSGGEAAKGGGVSWGETRELPLRVEPSQLARLDFRRGADMGGLPSGDRVIDLRLETDAGAECLRLPFTSSTSTAPWRPAKRWFVALSGRLALLRPASAALREPLLGGQLGRWFGNTRVWLEPGIAAGTRWAFSLGAHAEAVLLHQGIFALGVSGGYTATTTSPDFGGTEFPLLHGPQAALRLKLTLPPTLGTSGFPGGPQVDFVELTLPVDFWFGTGPNRRFVGPSAGLGFSVPMP